VAFRFAAAVAHAPEMVPWFQIEKTRGHQNFLRVSQGKPDKIWSCFAWSPTMANFPCPAQTVKYTYTIASYEMWHNKVTCMVRVPGLVVRVPVRVEDPFGISDCAGQVLGPTSETDRANTASKRSLVEASIRCWFLSMLVFEFVFARGAGR
jgi:hypothetical protein